MKKIRITGLVTVMLAGNLVAVAQKTIAEGTIVYDIALETQGSESKAASATTTVYLKGTQSRTDMVSVLGTESTIIDQKTGNGVILKEYSGQKLMITLTRENWAEKNRKYDDIVFTETGETKVIAGYTCKKATAKLKDGSSVITVYYATDLVPANKEYTSTFKNLPGLAMQYEFSAGKTKYTYTVKKISFEGVMASLFDIPKSGYRVMTYEENKQIKKGEK